MIFSTNEKILEKLNEKHINIEHLYILDKLYNNSINELSIYDKSFNDKRVLSMYRYLNRIGLIDQCSLTCYCINNAGTELYLEIISLLDLSNPSLENEKLFDEWWSTYPSNDGFVDTQTGQVFSTTRTLRSNKKKVYTKYIATLNDFKQEDLIGALKYEIKTRKLESVKSGKNNLTFMQNSLTYLNSGSYEGFVDLYINNKEFISNMDELSNFNINWG